MIVSTKNGSSVIKRVIGNDKSVVISIDHLIQELSIDPYASKPRRDCYIVSDDDLKSPRVRSQFEQQVAAKHPNIKIIFINKKQKNPMYSGNVPGIDIMLTVPKPEDISNAIASLCEEGITNAQKRELGRSYTDKIPQGSKEIKEVPTYKAKRQEQIAARRQGPVKRTPEGFIITEIDESTRYATDYEGNNFLVDTEGYAAPLDQFENPIYVDESGIPLSINLTPLVNLPEYAPQLKIDAPEVFEEKMATDEEYAAAVQSIEEVQFTTVEDINFTDGNLEINDPVDPNAEELPIEPETDIQYDNRPVAPKAEVGLQSNIISRIEDTSKVSEVAMLMKEMKATELVKDLLQSNASYAGIEEKLKSLENTIYVIMTDSTLSLDDRLNKVYAVTHDKAKYLSSGGTIIEQRLEEIVNVIITQTREHLNKRLAEIDTAIKRSARAADIQDQPALLAGLSDERADIICELRGYLNDISEIFKGTDNLVGETAALIGERAIQASGDELIDAQIKARGAMIIPSSTKDSMLSAIDISRTEIPEQFGKMDLDINTLLKTMNKLLEVDDEIAKARDAIIDKLRLKNPENMVISSAKIKQSLRVFVAAENSGRTVVPYLISKFYGRTSNTLLIDLTGTNKLDNYGIPYMSWADYVTELNCQDFLTVVGTIPDTAEAANQALTVLTKAADHYRVINLVIRPDQINLFNLLVEDILSVNYIVDTVPRNLEFMKSFIHSIKLDNVGQRVILNKCDVPIRVLLDKLGLLDSIDYQICSIDNLPAISNASLTKFDPSVVNAVKYAFEEILRNVKS